MTEADHERMKAAMDKRRRKLEAWMKKNEPHNYKLNFKGPLAVLNDGPRTRRLAVLEELLKTSRPVPRPISPLTDKDWDWS